MPGKLGVDRVTESSSITEQGWAADARQLNSSIEGTLAHEIEELKNSAADYSDQQYKLAAGTDPVSVERDGFAQAYVRCGNTGGWFFMKLIINGTPVYSGSGIMVSDNAGYNSPIFPVNKGDKIKIESSALNGNAAITAIYENGILFYPLRKKS